VQFKVDEIVPLGDNLAFVRTESHGAQIILANEEKTEELNRVFFLFRFYISFIGRANERY